MRLRLNGELFSFLSLLVIFLLLLFNLTLSTTTTTTTSSSTSSTNSSDIVTLVLLIRNKAHYLPYFLGYIERLSYNKSLLQLYIRVDYCQDDSGDRITKWLSAVKLNYRDIFYLEEFKNVNFPEESSDEQWPDGRHYHLMTLRQQALEWSRKTKSNYLFYLDGDVILENANTIEELINNMKFYNNDNKNNEKEAFVIAPLLNCSDSNSFSNFWGEQNSKGFYKRSENYFDIRTRRIRGIFAIAVVHSAYLLNLQHSNSDLFQFLPIINKNNKVVDVVDDIVIFSKNLREINGIALVDNTLFYGYFPTSLDALPGSTFDLEQFQHLKLQVMLDKVEFQTLQPSSYLPADPHPNKTRLSFDEIYLINLQRRTDRLEKMNYCLNEIGLNVTLFPAIDGRSLNVSYLTNYDIKQLPGYADPYHNRGLKYGEIGCFMSHYFIWQEMLAKGYDKILILEDDIRFSAGFLRNLQLKLQKANFAIPNWELFYIGRKRMSLNETWIPKSDKHLVYPEYTYWTLGYSITRNGVIKLLNQKPLNRMIAVDEYLPIMFNRHPRKDWASAFGPRDLIAISAEPLLLEPTHYTGEPHYISDTEDSQIIQ